MAQNLRNTLKKRRLKTVVFLLALLVLTFLPAEQIGYAAFDGSTLSTRTHITGTVNNVNEAGVESMVEVLDTGIAGDSEKLPQTGGISPSTLIGLLGLAFITTGGKVITILKKKNHGKND